MKLLLASILLFIAGCTTQPNMPVTSDQQGSVTCGKVSSIYGVATATTVVLAAGTKISGTVTAECDGTKVSVTTSGLPKETK